MLFLFLFSRIFQEQILSSLPSPLPLTSQDESCGGLSITLKENSTQILLYPQYQVNEGDLQDDTIFNNLTPNTLYKFTARYRSYPPSVESEEYIFDCNDYEGPSGPYGVTGSKRIRQTNSYLDIDPLSVEIVNITDTSVILNSIQPIPVNVDL